MAHRPPVVALGRSVRGLVGKVGIESSMGGLVGDSGRTAGYVWGVSGKRIAL